MATKEDKTTALVREYIAQGKDTLSIVIAGKMGTGKSSLVNGIIGKMVAKEKASASTHTTKIEAFEDQIKTSEGNVVRVRVWDTPGLGDAFGNDEATAKEIAGKCKDADLLLYCMDMRQRLTIDDVNGITQLTQALGTEVWKNAIFALTFANEVKPPPDSGEDRVKVFKIKFVSWRDAIIQQLKEKLSIPDDSEIIKDISVVPTGFHQGPLPDRDDWFTPFWLEAFRKANESAQPTLVGINIRRMTTVQPNRSKIEVQPHEMPIHLPSGKTSTTYGLDAIREALDNIKDSELYGMMPLEYGLRLVLVIAESIKKFRHKLQEYKARKLRKT